MNGDFLTGDRIPIHMQFTAGQDPDHIVFNQVIPAAAKKHTVHAGSFLHGFQNCAWAPFAHQVTVSGPEIECFIICLQHNKPPML